MVTETGRPVHRLRLWLRIHSHLYAFLRERLYGVYHASGLSAHSRYLDPAALSEWPSRIREVGWPAGRAALVEIDA